MENEVLELKFKNMQEDFGRRLTMLETKLAQMDAKEDEFTTSITKIESLLEQIKDSLNKLNEGTKESFTLVHNRVSSVKKDFEEHQQRELDNYISAKNAIVGAVLTVLASTLMGALLSAYQLSGAR